jgi:hypothetical protein
LAGLHVSGSEYMWKSALFGMTADARLTQGHHQWSAARLYGRAQLMRDAAESIFVTEYSGFGGSLG